jgi:hypothetical protein
MDETVLDIGRSIKSADLVPEGMSFPATKDQILQHARDSHLPPDVLQKLDKLPDKKYDNIADMVRAAMTE